MAILVTGGAGYIGSHTVIELLNKGEDVVVLDNLEKGHAAAVTGGKFIKADLRDKESLKSIFKENDIEAVIHFAGYIEAGESMGEPLKFYGNNFVLSMNLLSQMREAGVDKIIFSSTAAVYGEPNKVPIKEDDVTLPVNPYGETKLAVEKMLKWCDNAYGTKYIALRYFNAAGAHKSGKTGEDHDPETHLIPIVLQAAQGQRKEVYVFGDNYNTPDGSCVRDYVHVSDLANAHILALERLRHGGQSTVFNVGNGNGFSVKEVINAASEVTGVKIKQVVTKRRPGDPAVLIASSNKIRQELNWKPQMSKLKDIISTAWNWHKKHPNGFDNK